MQSGKVLLTSQDGMSVPMIFNNISGKNFQDKPENEYEDYINYVAVPLVGITKDSFEPVTMVEILSKEGEPLNYVELNRTTIKC